MTSRSPNTNEPWASPFHAYGIPYTTTFGRTSERISEAVQAYYGLHCSKDLLLLTFANREVAEEWWKLIKAADPLAFRDPEHRFHFAIDLEAESNIWDGEEFAHLKGKWFFRNIGSKMGGPPVHVPASVVPADLGDGRMDRSRELYSEVGMDDTETREIEAFNREQRRIRRQGVNLEAKFAEIGMERFRSAVDRHGERIEALEKRVQEIENRLAEQDAVSP